VTLDRSLEALRQLATGPGSRADKARDAIRLIRALGAYRWAGLYDVSATELVVLAWDGPEPPTHPRFPVTKGLNGAAVSTRTPVVVQDVTADSRYLTTIGGTRGEMIQPIVAESGRVVGTIDVESDRVNAFSERDQALLAQCARDLRWLWEHNG
jgi:L-methionine (R)-S-oxide reductase